ncbi:MAG TPA: hypothetical protein VK901_14220 [Nitrospiraceae bacterium]|nr:hypothetical protein [Nitrospiraceae bacterium]
MLQREAWQVDYRCVSTLMERMRIPALFYKLNTHTRHPSRRIYPHLLRQLTISHSNHEWGPRTSVLQPETTRVRFSIRHNRLGGPPGLVVAAVQHRDHRLLYRDDPEGHGIQISMDSTGGGRDIMRVERLWGS